MSCFVISWRWRQVCIEIKGVEVTLIDSTFVPDEQLPSMTFHAACGAALVGWLKGSQGARVAGFSGIAPPAYFLSAVPPENIIGEIPIPADF